MNIIINGKEVDKSQLLYFLENNQKLVAIKFIKDRTNIGLKECKEIVDNLELNPDYYDDGEEVIEINRDFYEGKTSNVRVDSVKDSKKEAERKPHRGNYLKDPVDSKYDAYIIIFIVACVLVAGYIFFNK